MLSELELLRADAVSQLIEYERFNMPIRVTYEKGRIAAFTTSIELMQSHCGTKYEVTHAEQQR